MINPHLSDEDFIKGHAILSKRQSRKDHIAAKAEGGFDAAIIASTRTTRPSVREDFRRPVGMSRSGALEPGVKSRLARAEAEGRIEIQRNQYGEIEAYRDLQDEGTEQAL